MSLISELKRRNVFRVGAAYVVTSWLIIQVAETILPVYDVPDSVIRYIISALAALLLPVLALAWAFQITPEGLTRDRGAEGAPTAASPAAHKAFDRVVMVLLALALGYFAFDKFVLSASRETAIAAAAREEGRAEAVVDAFGERSIAVLPFVDMSPDKDQEYMSDGIAEEVLNLLARVPDFRVISRSSAFSFKGKDIDIPSIARQLNAAYILEGSVRKAGERIRITAQLIDARSDTHRWSDTYDRELTDVFAIQDEIAARVVEELKSQMLAEAPRSNRLDAEAYTLALQARYLWNRRAEGDEQRALELYQQAVAIDPGYAPAWTGLSVAYAVAAYAGRIEREEGLAQARAAVEKALQIDPHSAEAHVRLGQALARERDYLGMKREYEWAFASDPNNPLTLGVMAQLAGRQGDIDGVVAFYDRAAAADPLGAIWPGNKGSWLICMGRLDEAEAAVRRAFELNGNRSLLDEHMADVHILRGDFGAARETLGRLPLADQNVMRTAVVEYRLGNTDRARELVDSMQALDNPFASFGVAQYHAAVGNADLAFEWLTKAGNIGAWNIAYDPYIRLLQDDPRWRPFVDSLGWPWEYAY